MTELTLDSRGREMQVGSNARFGLSVNENNLSQFDGGFVPLHWHTQIELFWQITGSAEMQVNDATFVVPAGGIILINSGAMHACRPVEGGRSTHRTIVFDTNIVSGLPGSIFDMKYVRPLLQRGAAAINMSELPGAAEIKKNMDRIFEVCRDERDGFEFEARDALSRIILSVGKDSVRQQGSRPANLQEDRVKRMLNWIDANIGSDVQLDQIAREGCVCPRVCQRLFQRYLHCTPGEYVQRARIMRAAEAIAHSGEPITDIAAENGFPSPSYFTKMFRRYLNCTPREYRREKQEKASA